MATDYMRTQIRLPPELHEKLVEAAASSARSFNAEMVVRLESSFRRDMEQSTLPAASQVKLTKMQRELFDGVRRLLRMEALMSAPKLTRAQKLELQRLQDGGEDDQNF